MRPVEAVIFDYGGVISLPLTGALDQLESELGIPPNSLLALLFGEGAQLGPGGDTIRNPGGDVIDGPTVDDPSSVAHEWHQLEVGAITFAEYVAGVTARAPAVIGHELDLAVYGKLSDAIPIGVHWAIVHEIRALRAQGLALALLTNNVAEFGDTWRSTFPVDDLFPIVVDSSHVGMRKPDPGIYTLTCERLGVALDACVFLDDNQYNCDAATALGIESVRVTDDPDRAITELRAILDRRGVHTQSDRRG